MYIYYIIYVKINEMIDFSHRSSGGSFGGSKVSNDFSAAASERQRLEGAMEEHRKNELIRARQQLSDLMRKLEHNKYEITSKNVEIRRLTQEITRADAEVRSLENTFKIIDTKAKASKIVVSNFQLKLQERQKDSVKSKLEVETKKREEKKLEMELVELQRKISETKRAIQEAEQKIKEIDLETRHLEGKMHGNADDINHDASEKAYKEKEVDNKKKAMFALEQRKKHQEEDIERLLSENKRMEVDIRTLESRIK